MGVSQEQAEEILKAIKGAVIPEEHWIQMHEMIKEENERYRRIDESQKLSDEDWYKRFTI